MNKSLYCILYFIVHVFTLQAQQQVEKHLSYLASDELMGRNTSSEGIDKAATYIEAFFNSKNVKPYYKTYRDSFAVKGDFGYNIIGLVEGTDKNLKKEYIIIGAHYDHIGTITSVAKDSIANGANDNASGTVAVMEMAAHFSAKPTKRSLLFVLFSAEEMGLLGSKHLAKRIKKEEVDVYTVFNIEMIGVPMKNKSYLAYFTGYEESNFAERFNFYTQSEVLGFLPQAKEYQLFRRSDNYPFFKELAIPAQTACTFDFTNYEFYHHVDDETPKMDFEHMEKVIDAFILGIEGMANTPEKEIKLK